jgi:hypothetical protein
MIPITRYHLPTECPRCKGIIQKYHGGGVTKYVCAKPCSGFQEVMATIDHEAEERGDKDAIMMIDLECE